MAVTSGKSFSADILMHRDIPCIIQVSEHLEVDTTVQSNLACSLSLGKHCQSASLLKLADWFSLCCMIAWNSFDWSSSRPLCNLLKPSNSKNMGKVQEQH